MMIHERLEEIFTLYFFTFDDLDIERNHCQSNGGRRGRMAGSSPRRVSGIK